MFVGNLLDSTPKTEFLLLQMLLEDFVTFLKNTFYLF